MQTGPFTQRPTDVSDGYKIKDLKSLGFWVGIITVALASEAACGKLAPHLHFYRPLLSAAVCAAIPAVAFSVALLRLLPRSDPRRIAAAIGVWGSAPAALRMALWDMGRRDLDAPLVVCVSTTLVFVTAGVIAWRCGGIRYFRVQIVTVPGPC